MKDEGQKDAILQGPAITNIEKCGPRCCTGISIERIERFMYKENGTLWLFKKL